MSEKLHQSYPYLSTLFSEMQGSTLEQYIIAQRIEMVKHLLMDQRLGLSEIAWKIGYSSVPHLSNQFKKTTGMSPSEFKANAQNNLDPPDELCGSCGRTWVVPAASNGPDDPA